jgi:hypothetical protein
MRHNRVEPISNLQIKKAGKLGKRETQERKRGGKKKKAQSRSNCDSTRVVCKCSSDPELKEMISTAIEAQKPWIISQEAF